MASTAPASPDPALTAHESFDEWLEQEPPDAHEQLGRL